MSRAGQGPQGRESTCVICAVDRLRSQMLEVEDDVYACPIHHGVRDLHEQLTAARKKVADATPAG